MRQNNFYVSAWSYVWGGMLDCSPAYLPTKNVTQLHQKLCCRITNSTFLNLKFSDFKQEPTSSLKMTWIMIETWWSVFKCFNINILD